MKDTDVSRKSHVLIEAQGDRASAITFPQLTSESVAPPSTWKMLIQTTIMTMLAGFVDALGYTAMGHLYLSFMSGNSTQFGMAIAGGNTHVVVWAGAVIAVFVLGAFMGSMVHEAERWINMPLVLLCEFVCLLLAWSLGEVVATTRMTLLFVAVAMGMQNALHKPVAGAATGKSFITGALFGTGDALARCLLGRARLAEAAAYAFSWLAFVVGVTGGAFGVNAFGIGPALLAAISLVLVLITLSLLWRQ